MGILKQTRQENSMIGELILQLKKTIKNAQSKISEHFCYFSLVTYAIN